jgi:hypothetical protein
MVTPTIEHYVQTFSLFYFHFKDTVTHAYTVIISPEYSPQLPSAYTRIFI